MVQGDFQFYNGLILSYSVSLLLSLFSIKPLVIEFVIYLKCTYNNVSWEIWSHVIMSTREGRHTGGSTQCRVLKSFLVLSV